MGVEPGEWTSNTYTIHWSDATAGSSGGLLNTYDFQPVPQQTEKREETPMEWLDRRVEELRVKL